MNLNKKIQKFSNINQQINSLNVLQEFMDIIGKNTSVDDKLKAINETLMEKYEIKYSTIVVFNGAEYTIKATNVDFKHWETMKNLHAEPIFKDSISTATSKYITIEKDNDRLPYQKMEFARAKSAMFFPLYIDNVYMGYWIIESGKMHAFDSVDTSILDVIRENIVSVLKTVTYQNTIESIARTDLLTGLYSAEYLYGKGKNTIDKYTSSTVCMFTINNIQEINEMYSRKTGNNVIIEVSKLVKSAISSEYILVRYMGPKFVIIFSGVEPEAVIEFLKEMKKNIESLNVKYVPDKVKENTKPQKEITVSPTVNFILSTYYKGTAIEGVTQKLEDYINNAPKNEHKISYI